MLGQLLLGQMQLGGNALFGSAGLPAPVLGQPVGGNNKVYLNWAAVVGATSYDVDGSPDNSTWTNISSAQAGLHYTDTSAVTRAATSGYAYYRIKANGAIPGNYVYSGPVSPHMLVDLTTGADNTLITAHAPNLDQFGNLYSMFSDGTAKLSSNKIVTGTSGVGGFVIFGMDTNQTDLQGSCTLQVGTGVMLRYVDTTHYFEIGLSSGLMAIYVAGNVTPLASAVVVASGTTDYPVTFSVVGNVITATFVNSNTTITYTISGAYTGSLSSTNIGWVLDNSGAITNIRVAAGNYLSGLVTDLPGDNGTVSTWTDATTNGNNGTQATGANQPTVVAAALNGHKAMRFAATKFMDLNVQPVSKQFTQVALLKPSVTNVPNVIFGGDYTADVSSILWLNSSAFPNVAYAKSSAVNTDVVSTTALSTSAYNLVINNAWHDNPAGLGTVSPACQNNHLYVNGVFAGTSKAPQQQPISQAGISIANLKGAPVDGFTGDIAHMAIASSVSGPSAADINRLIAKYNDLYNLDFPIFKKQLITIGDSITNGFLATTGGAGSWAYRCAKTDTSRYFVNKGQPSIGLQGSNSIVSEIASQFAPIVACGVPTTAVIFAGTNDIALYSATGAQVYAGIVSLCTTLRAMGVSKIIVVSMLPRGGTVETQRQALNNALRADGLVHFDALADVETVPAIGAAGANTDTNYYTDGTHPNDTLSDGHGLLFNLINPLI